MRCGRDDLGADAIPLDGLDDGVDPHLARGAAGDLLGEFAGEVDELLDEQGSPAGVFGERGEPVVGLGRGRHHPHALAVVAAARRLHDSAPAVGIEEELELVRRGHGRPVGLRHPELLQTRAHDELVLREAQRVRPRVHRDARVDEGDEHRLRHVLVVEGDDVHLPRERQHRGEVAVIAHGRCGEGCRHPRLLGEHLHLDAELHRRSDHHPGQLSSADHSDTQRHGAPSLASIIPSS